jgi:hypothetical protein
MPKPKLGTLECTIFLRRRNPNTDKRDWRGAIEDAFILFCIALITNLTAYGYPPTPPALYSSILTALLTFFLSIQRRFKIPAPERASPTKSGKGD